MHSESVNCFVLFLVMFFFSFPLGWLAGWLSGNLTIEYDKSGNLGTEYLYLLTIELGQ